MTSGVARRSSLQATLGIAAALHLGLIGVALRTATTPGEGAHEAPMELSVSEVEVEPPVAPPAPVTPNEAVEPAAPESAPAVNPPVAGRPPRTASSQPGQGAAAEVPGPPVPAASGAAEDGWSFSPTGGPTGPAGALGLGGAVGAGVRATVAESVRRERGDPLHSNTPIFSARDIELGIVPGSNLVGLTRDRVRIGLTPTTGHAVLAFQLDGSGVVASVQVVDASSDRADWDDVAARVVRDAHEAPPSRMPAGARGVTVTLDVQSSERTVSGAAPGGGIITKTLRAINDPVDSIIDGKTPVQRVVAVRIVGVQAF